MRRKDTGRPGNGGKYDHTAGQRSTADLGPSAPAEHESNDSSASDILDSLTGLTDIDKAAAYQAAAARADRDWRSMTDSAGMMPREEMEAQYRQTADYFEGLARSAANVTDPVDLPGPGESTSGYEAGLLDKCADYGSWARLNADIAPFNPSDIGAGAIARRERALDMRSFTAANGVPFHARIIRKGQAYGASDSLVAKEDLVEFYDARYPHKEIGLGAEGQFVSRYNVRDLRDHRRGVGLDLDSGIPAWKIDGTTYDHVVDWMDRRAPLRDNPFASCANEEDLRRELADAMEANSREDKSGQPNLYALSRQRNRLTQAFETRLREITRGWDSVRP